MEFIHMYLNTTILCNIALIISVIVDLDDHDHGDL